MSTTTRIALVLAAATLAACGGSNGYGSTSPPPVNGQTVNATASLAFTPDSLAVDVGDTVAFAFAPVPHNVFFEAQDGAPANIAGTNTNVTVRRAFAASGTYAYTCHSHPQMHGKVVAR